MPGIVDTPSKSTSTLYFVICKGINPWENKKKVNVTECNTWKLTVDEWKKPFTRRFKGWWGPGWGLLVMIKREVTQTFSHGMGTSLPLPLGMVHSSEHFPWHLWAASLISLTAVLFSAVTWSKENPLAKCHLVTPVYWNAVADEKIIEKPSTVFS